MALQAAFVAGILLIPLLDTYPIDPALWARSTFLLAPPRPAAPPAPVPETAVARRPRRYEAAFSAPLAIPDRVSLLRDAGAPLSPLAAPSPSGGPPGGLGQAGVPGVLGIVPGLGDGAPLPPPVRVGGRVQNARIVERALPVYPPEAVEQRVAGTVKLEAIIGIDGAVRDLSLVEGHPLLAPAAIEAVRQWRYRPTLLNGRAVEVVTLIDVHFNLTVLDEKEIKRRMRQARRERGAN